MALSEAKRRALVASYVTTGMGPDRARLIIDVAAQAVDEGIEALRRKCKLLPDPGAYISGMALALQLLSIDAAEQFHGLHELGKSMGAIDGSTTVDLKEKD